MINHQKYNVTDDGRVYFVPYIPDVIADYQQNNVHPGILMLPGGGYAMTSDREAEPMALKYVAEGFNVFVLRYSVAENAYWPNPIVDTMKAMKMIRENAEAFHQDATKIAVLGYSAGGHLAATLSTLWNDEELCKIAGVTPAEVQPQASILYYPVISSTPIGHQGSINALMQKDMENTELRAKMAMENNVGPHTPPTFICHTCEDACVNVLNSLVYAEALAKNSINFELIVSPHGRHGLATGDMITNERTFSDSKEWTIKAIKWLRDVFGYQNG